VPERVTVDVEALFVQLLDQALTTAGWDVLVRSEVDADLDPVDDPETPTPDVSDLERPLLLLRAYSGQKLNGRGPGLAWSWQLAMAIVGFGRDAMVDLADAVYVATHGLDDGRHKVPGIGAVAGVDDVAMPSRVATSVVQGQDLHQYDATFEVVVRPAPPATS
jgi:hypothetical protein